MTSIGETLRRERLRRNLGLDQISHELKISPKLLEAIEAEKFDRLPGTIFAKNFVRQYAHFLGLDEEEMAAEVQRLLQPQTELPRFAETGHSAAPPIQVPKVEAWETVGERRFSWSSPLPALALFVVAMLVCSSVYAWYQRTRRPVLAQNSAATETVPPPQLTPPVAPQTQSAQPEALPPVSVAQQKPALPVETPVVKTASVPAQAQTAPPRATGASANPNATVRVELTADEPTWVLVRSDGKFLFSGTLDAKQSRTVEASNNLELRLGNAGGVTIVLNGNPIGAVGPKGQVRTVQFTSGGFQIVAAPKSAPLIDPL
jgi:cytoskeleton protein RodZ